MNQNQADQLEGLSGPSHLASRNGQENPGHALRQKGGHTCKTMNSEQHPIKGVGGCNTCTSGAQQLVVVAANAGAGLLYLGDRQHLSPGSAGVPSVNDWTTTGGRSLPPHRCWIRRSGAAPMRSHSGLRARLRGRPRISQLR